MKTLHDSFLAFPAQGVAGTGCEAPISKAGAHFLTDSHHLISYGASQAACSISS